MPSSNPVLRPKTFQGPLGVGERMTMNGTIAKTGLLVLLALVTGGWTWHRFTTAAVFDGPDQAFAAIAPYLWGGLGTGFALAVATVFARRWAGVTAPLYAIAEGFVLGGVSALMEVRHHGIVMQAVLLTVDVLAAMLLLYRTRVIAVTQRFRIGVVAATGAIALLYLVDIGLRGFTSLQVPFIHESGGFGIGFSVLVVGLAALNLVLDFDLIERGAAQGAPGAFALMVTLVWLYLELLRLLSKARR